MKHVMGHGRNNQVRDNFTSAEVIGLTQGHCKPMTADGRSIGWSMTAMLLSFSFFMGCSISCGIYSLLIIGVCSFPTLSFFPPLLSSAVPAFPLFSLFQHLFDLAVRWPIFCIANNQSPYQLSFVYFSLLTNSSLLAYVLYLSASLITVVSYVDSLFFVSQIPCSIHRLLRHLFYIFDFLDFLGFISAIGSFS